MLEQYEPGSLLLRQAVDEVFFEQLEEPRLQAALQRIEQSRIIITDPEYYTPLCFPIKVDSIREAISSESLEERVLKMIKADKRHD